MLSRLSRSSFLSGLLSGVLRVSRSCFLSGHLTTKHNQNVQNGLVTFAMKIQNLIPKEIRVKNTNLAQTALPHGNQPAGVAGVYLIRKA